MTSTAVWRHTALALVAASAFCAAGGVAAAEGSVTPPPAPQPGPWDIEPFKNGLVAVSRYDDQRTAILLFCTLYGTRSLLYAYDGRGQESELIPISEVRVRMAPTVLAMGLVVASDKVTFDNDGYIIRMQIPLPGDFSPPDSGAITIGSGPEAIDAYRWLVALGREGLEDSVRIAFKNCV